MTMRVGDIMSLVLGLGAGMALVRFDYSFGLVLAEPTLMYCNDLLVDAFAGFAVAAGGGLGVERLRSRGAAKGWGIGRWTLALSAAAFLLGGITTAATQAIHQYTQYGEIRFVDHLLVVTFEIAVESSSGSLVGFLIVFLLTGLLAPSQGREVADYREWSGRVFGGLLIAWRTVIYVYALLHPDDWRIS